jgi:hypothetical protein
MPLNLLSVGIGTQLFPLTADWVQRLGIVPTLRRLSVLSIALLLFGGCYFALLWLVRVWVFASMLHQQFPQRDLLLALWFGVFALMLIRDQLVKLLAACERFPPLAWVTVASSVVSLACSYESMLRWGEAGAVGGVLCGELVNVIGIVILTCLQIRRRVPVPA